jgi:hypothetical protein
VDTIDNNAVARADPSRGVTPAVQETAGPRAMMGGVAIFLTSRSLRILVAYMRRVLRVRTAFEATRCAEEQLQLAYERVVPTVRRACGSVEDATQIGERRHSRQTARNKKVMQ